MDAITRRGYDVHGAAAILDERERAAILDDQVRLYVARGYRVLARTATTAQLVRPKRFNAGAAILWTLVLLVGLLIYLFIYAAGSDDVVYLEVGPDGSVMRSGNGAIGRSGGRECHACGHVNGPSRATCKRCHSSL